MPSSSVHESAWSGFEDEHEEHDAEVEEEAVAEEQPLGENAIKRLIQEEVAKVSAAQAEEAPSFGDTVASESQTHQAMLEQLKPFYPQIRKVQNLATQRVSFEYAYSFSDPDGFWSIPSPTLHNPITEKKDSFGSFGVLPTPTINKHWSFTTKSLKSEAEEEDSQAQAEKSAPRSFDALVKPAVPSSCVSEDMESFLSSGPLAEWKTQVHGQPVGRYLSVDPEIFQQTSLLLSGMLILYYQI